MLSGNQANPVAGADDAAEALSKATSESDEMAPARVAIRISEDKTKAFIAIHPPLKMGGGPLTADFILRRWLGRGLDPEALTNAVAQGLADEWNSTRLTVPEREVAEAPNPPLPGRNARMEFIVDPTLRFKPVEQGGNIDFRSLNLIKPVQQGQPLARKIPATLGVHGIDLFGNPAPASDGVDIEITLGANTELSAADPNMVLASLPGFLQHKEGVLSVNECFVVDGSVDFSTGNISYDQSAMIRGDIGDGFTVNVGGALEVGGAVGEAKLLIGGDVLIKKGFVGSGHGLITAKGGVNLGFASNQTIRAHGSVLLEKESFNCQIYSRKGISVFGPLVGGLAMAFREINCRVAGNDMGTKTELEAGMDYIHYENKLLLEDKIKELTGHLGKITAKLARFREAYRLRKRLTAAEAKLMLELRNMQDKIQTSLPELEKRKLDIAEKIRQGYLVAGLCVKVEKKVNPGVIIKVGPEILRVQEEMNGPKTFLYQNGRIKVL
ncbi:MAG: FapA family protein [Fibrobacteria bacterium]